MRCAADDECTERQHERALWSRKHEPLLKKKAPDHYQRKRHRGVDRALSQAGQGQDEKTAHGSKTQVGMSKSLLAQEVLGSAPCHHLPQVEHDAFVGH